MSSVVGPPSATGVAYATGAPASPESVRSASRAATFGDGAGGS
ncbi:hypothetical protein SGL43_03615 [Streptomyces globisporus]|uniref:Uncharacterized protein n=1 Tax=Streptomyces globisporus TaxID=1908 RepID=A0ABM9GY88_STRGL|nr:hypothetical protein SGL43_03615 [Streptomyces globisporus]